MYRAFEPLTRRRIQGWLGREQADENQVERSFSSDTLEDPHPSKILRTRSSWTHKVGELYDDMIKKDTDLEGILLKRSDAVLGLPRRVEPRGGDPASLEAADLCRHVMEDSVPGIVRNLRHQLDYVPKGLAIEEMVWDEVRRGPFAGAVLPVEMIGRPMWRFAFKRGNLHVRQPNGKTVPAEPWKYLVSTAGSKDKPHGEALLDSVYWYWFTKLHGWRFYSIFIEKWSMPTVIVDYPQNKKNQDGSTANREQQAKALALGRAIQAEQTAAVPEGLKPWLLETIRTGAVSYESFLSLCTRGMALVFLGEINTSGLRPGTGAFASDQVADEIRKEKVGQTAQELADNVREQVFRPVVELNLGPDVPVPDLIIDTVEAEDRELRQRGIERALRAGEEVPRRYYLQTHQIPAPKHGEEVVKAKPQPSPFGFGGFPAQAPTPPGDDGRDDADDESDDGDDAADASARRVHVLLQRDSVERTAEDRITAIDEVAAALVDDSLTYYQAHRDLVGEAVEQGMLEEGRAMTWLAERLDPSTHIRHLEAAQVHAMGLGLRDLIVDGVGDRFWRADRSRDQPRLLDLPLQARRHLQAPSGIEGFSTPEDAVEFWTQLLQVPRDVFDGYSAANRRLAFTAAGVEEVALLRDLHQLFQGALAQGLPRAEVQNRIDDLYGRHGVTPTSRWHADLLYSNNTRQAQGAIRYGQTVENPTAQRILPYLRFVTLGDHRVRDRPGHNHAVMHDMVFATGHEIWRTWWYPAGHGCRCYVVSVNRVEAARLGLTGAEPTGPWPIDRHSGRRALPDPGFESSPSLAALAQLHEGRLFDQVASVADESGDPAGRDLLSGLRTIVEKLLGFDVFGALGLQGEGGIAA